ncbi:hypothetical protein EDD11_010421 [Mortierella claussenii]|nr:hypothetical protein EDD11_010421 [Mortierella claussenii]
MFYSKDILVRKDNSLGLIWLAATVGSHRSGINKLSRKEVNGVNIVKTCKDISQPPEPFALRFSSNLMVGVTRVYSQQYSFYHTDVNHVWMRLKRDLALVQSENFDMAQPEARMNMITFDYDLTVEPNILQTVKLVQDFEMETARRGRTTELAFELGWASQPVMDLKETQSEGSSPNSSLLLLTAADQRRRMITLDEKTVPGSRPAIQYGGRLDLSLCDDAFVNEDSSLYIDSEGNLVDYAPAMVVEESTKAPLVPQQGDRPAALFKRGRENIVLAQTEQHAIDGYPFQDHDQAAIIDLQPDAVVPLKRLRTQGPKLSRLIIDEHTMLSREEIIEYRDNFLEHQAALNRDRNTKQMVHFAKARIDSLFSRPLSVSGCGPDLAAFWSKVSARTLAGYRTEPKNAGAIDLEGQYHEGTPLFELGNDLLAEEAPNIELRRRYAGGERSATPVDLGISGMEVSSVGSSGRHSAHMPWSTEMRTSVGAQSEHSSVGSDRLRREFEAVFDQGTGRFVQRARKASGSSRSDLILGELEEESSLIRRHHFHGARRRSHSRETARSRASNQQRVDGTGDGHDSSIDVHDPFMDLVEEIEPIPESQTEITDVTQDRITVERETINFFTYMQSMIKEAQATFISFSDVISSHRRRNVAASAFYHVLSLSTMGKITPTQVAPYIDIRIEILERGL